MKIIDYENTKGTFKIKYLDDNEIVDGSINIDDSSLNIDAVVAKLIINNSIGDIVLVEEEVPFKFQILEKNMTMNYIEVNEYDYFQHFKNYNERVKGIESSFVNVSEGKPLGEDNVLFQYYYKGAESSENDTASYLLKNYFTKGKRISDDVSPEGYFKEFDMLVRTFKTSFLANNNIDLSDFYLCSIRKVNNYGIDTLDDLIKEITKRDVRNDLNDSIDKQPEIVKDKNVIILTDIISDDYEIRNYRNKLKALGAKKVIMYAFAKTSCVKED